MLTFSNIYFFHELIQRWTVTRRLSSIILYCTLKSQEILALNYKISYVRSYQTFNAVRTFSNGTDKHVQCNFYLCFSGQNKTTNLAINLIFEKKGQRNLLVASISFQPNSKISRTIKSRGPEFILRKLSCHYFTG